MFMHLIKKQVSGTSMSKLKVSYGQDGKTYYFSTKKKQSKWWKEVHVKTHGLFFPVLLYIVEEIVSIL